MGAMDVTGKMSKKKPRKQHKLCTYARPEPKLETHHHVRGLLTADEPKQPKPPEGKPPEKESPSKKNVTATFNEKFGTKSHSE